MKVRIELRASGTNVWAYALDNDGVKSLQYRSQEAALDIVRTKYVSGSLLTWGVDRSSNPSPSVEILLEGEPGPIIKTLTNYEDWEIEEGVQSASDYIRISEADQIEIGREMEADVDMSSIKAIALESVYFEKILLWAEFDIDGPFNANLLKLYDNTMDCDTELSQALYPLGLPRCVEDGEENAILGVVYNDQKVQFESECSQSGPVELSLIVRDDYGDWSGPANVAGSQFVDEPAKTKQDNHDGVTQFLSHRENLQPSSLGLGEYDSISNQRKSLLNSLTSALVEINISASESSNVFGCNEIHDVFLSKLQIYVDRLTKFAGHSNRVYAICLHDVDNNPAAFEDTTELLINFSGAITLVTEHGICIGLLIDEVLSLPADWGAWLPWSRMTSNCHSTLDHIYYDDCQRVYFRDSNRETFYPGGSWEFPADSDEIRGIDVANHCLARLITLSAS